MLIMLATEHEIQRSQVVSQAAAAPFTAAREAAETAAGRLVQVVGQANRDLGRDGSTAEVVTCFLGRWAGYW